MEAILLVTTIFALFGAYLNSIGSALGFFIWILTNAVFACHNISIGQWQQGILFTAYLGIAINGIIHWERVKT